MGATRGSENRRQGRVLDVLARTVGRIVARSILFVVILLVPVVAARAESVSMSCGYDPDSRQVDVQTGEESVRLSVGGHHQILVNGSLCWEPSTYDESFFSAYTDNTDIVNVTGTDGVDDVTIDQADDGGSFPEEIDFTLALGDSVDTLHLELTGGDDDLVASPFSLSLFGGSGGVVDLEGVDAVEVQLGYGDDVLEATQAGVDPLFVPITASGGDGSDVLIGGSADDHLSGEAGRDYLDARGGNDELLGGADDDQMFGQAGSDLLDGGDGAADILVGGAGKDQCWFTDAYRPCDPTIDLQPDRATTGSTISVQGSGWYPENGPISIAFDGVEPSTVVTRIDQADGSFEGGPLEVPPDVGDVTRTVRACQCTDVAINEYSTTFEYVFAADVTLEIRPTSAKEGKDVLVTGSGWLADEEVRVFLDRVGGRLVARDTPGDDTRVDTSFTIRDVDAGEHRLVACQRCGAEGELVKTQMLMVLAVGGGPKVTATPSISPTGDEGSQSPLGTVGVLVGVVLLLGTLLVAVLSRIWSKAPRSGPEPTPPGDGVHARLADRPPSVFVETVNDGSSDHALRLIPVRDPGVVRVEEVDVR